MSGHSKWSTIKHQKEAKDQKRGSQFTKLGRAISIAARQGNSDDPDSNFALRLVIDKAKAANMPKENIRRAIDHGLGKGGEGGELKEVIYEGFGPQQSAIIVEAMTDNTNRTVSEIKKIFETRGGSLASPGSVSYMFKKVGQLLIEKVGNSEEAMLKLIDLGAEDVDDSSEEIKAYTLPEQLALFKDEVVKSGFKVSNMEITLKPIVLTQPKDKEAVAKLMALIDALEDHDDVSRTWTNVDLNSSL